MFGYTVVKEQELAETVATVEQLQQQNTVYSNTIKIGGAVISVILVVVISKIVCDAICRRFPKVRRCLTSN